MKRRAGTNFVAYLAGAVRRSAPLVIFSLLSSPVGANASVGDDADRGILELLSAQTVLTVGGRINLTAAWDTPAGSFSPAGTLASASGEENQMTMHLRNSRLWFKTRTPTSYGQMRTLIETDFGGTAGSEISSNSHNLRLRHAIFQLGGVTVGQTWSTFQTYVSPDILTDAAYIQWTRQPQLRWSGGGESVGYDIALEQAESTLTDSSGGQVLPADDRIPDLVTRLHAEGAWGRAGVALLLREIRQDQATLSDGVTVLQNSDSAVAWGCNLSALFKLGQQDDLRLGLISGKGVGRYLAQNAYNAGSVDNQGSIGLQAASGGYAAYRHWWSATLRSSIAHSVVQSDNDLTVVPLSVNKEAYSYHLNLLWTPLPNSQFGVEYAYLEREQEDGVKADMQRLYFELRYDF